MNEILVRAAGAGHKPQQHLLSVWQLAQIHLRKLKIMLSLVFKDDLQPVKIDQSINQLFFYWTLVTELNFIHQHNWKINMRREYMLHVAVVRAKNMCMVTKVAICFRATGSYHHVKLNSEIKIHYRGIHWTITTVTMTCEHQRPCLLTDTKYFHSANVKHLYIWSLSLSQ